jgi:drug/metabolite transporter (DMT)-like permease
MSHEKAKANSALLTVGLLFGLSSPMGRFMAQWTTPVGFVFIRSLFTLPFAIILFLKGARPKNLPYKTLAVFSTIYPISMCLYYVAVFNTKVSLAIFSFYVANVVSSILAGYFLNHEKVSDTKLIGFVLAFAAIICFTNPLQGFTIDSGMLFGYASGVIQTIASFYQKRLTKNVDERSLTLAQVIGSVVVTALLLVVMRDSSLINITWLAVLCGVILGLMNFGINYFMIYGFKYAEIGIGTVLMSSELIFGPVAAYLIFGETLTTLELIGGALIALSVVFVSRHKG